MYKRRDISIIQEKYPNVCTGYSARSSSVFFQRHSPPWETNPALSAIFNFAARFSIAGKSVTFYKRKKHQVNHARGFDRFRTNRRESTVYVDSRVFDPRPECIYETHEISRMIWTSLSHDGHIRQRKRKDRRKRRLKIIVIILYSRKGDREQNSVVFGAIERKQMISSSWYKY